MNYLRIILSQCTVLLSLHLLAQNVGFGTLTPTNPLTVNGSADFTGNVGIGITNPTKKLEVTGGDVLINGILIGRGAGNLISNTALGVNTLHNNTTGAQNTGCGYLSLALNTSGINNTGIGAYALNQNSTGNGNTAIGRSALQSLITGSDNTAIGSNAGASDAFLTNTTAIGANTVVSASNSLVLGNNANVGIGTSAPASKLEVVGTIKTSSLQLTSGGADGLIMISDASGNAAWSDPTSLETDPQVGTLSANRIPKWNGTSLTDGILYDNGTNIGLGTTSPGAKLDIRGANIGLRLLSGGTSSNHHTSFQLGRISTDGSLSVASAASQYAIGSSADDIILRTELSTQKLILNAGSGSATLTTTNGKVGIGTTVPANKLDITGGIVIGTGYAGVSIAPTGGALIQGNVGIGTPEPQSTLHVVGATSKTNTDIFHISFFTTNEPLISNPFGLRFSLAGGAGLGNRYANLQTTDINENDGGTISLQRHGGAVSIGTTSPNTTLNVEGGIRTRYAGSVVIEFLNDVTEYNITLSPALPAGWDFTNTVVLLSVVDGAPARIWRAKILDEDTLSIIKAGSNGLCRINYIIFKI